ncbi:helix-turn-helix domain-containing protein [Phaeovulum sp. W22_SRMD_FR3]|uniref:helix-turn-helix domain-containing protein n=1 Tax=Phaeovulum sp. W22_SRMD_FR3 TaxID=3240274 RepID=UPI003F95EA95
MNQAVPIYALYGESDAFPDLLHCEEITDRASLHDWEIAPHRHPNLHQVFVLLRGQAQIHVDGTDQTPALPVILSVPRGAVHSFTFAQGTEGFVLTLPVAEFPAAFGEGSALRAPLARWGMAPLTDELRAAVLAISAEHAGDAKDRAVMLHARAMQLLCHLTRGLPDDGTSTHSDRHMERFDAQIRAHLRDHWTLAAYCAALAMTPTHLNRITRRCVGLSAARYIETRLFHEACRMLAYTRMGVAEVGYSLGFNDPAYFSRAFRRHTGQTPGAYRARFNPPGTA